MNNEHINTLSLRLQELQVARATVIGPAADLLDKEIDNVKRELKQLNPTPSLAAAIVAKVDGVDISDCDITRYDDVLPIVAIKSINGAAKAMISHIRYTNGQYERMMARQATRVAGTSSWQFKTQPESTSPYESDDDRMLRYQEEVKGCIDELAVLKANWERAANRYVQETGRELYEFDLFPDVAGTIRYSEAMAAENAARAKAKGAVAVALTPNVISML